MECGSRTHDEAAAPVEARQLPILLINLLGAAERRQVSLERLRALGLSCTFVRAVDGHALPDRLRAAYSADLNGRTFKRPLSLGEIGCYLSHYEAWKIAAAGNQPAVVLEDDFEAGDDFPGLLARLRAQELPDALIKLDGPRRRSRVIRHITADHDLVDPWIPPPLTVGYVITPRAARILLSSALPFGRPIDLDLKHWWELGIRVLAVSPGPVRGSAADSQIELGRMLARQSAPPLKRLYRNLRYQTGFHINLLCARNGIGPLHRGAMVQARGATT